MWMVVEMKLEQPDYPDLPDHVIAHMAGNLRESEQRKMLEWFKEHKPNLCKEVFETPYHLNEREKGHKKV
jgi:hypothetical protein